MSHQADYSARSSIVTQPSFITAHHIFSNTKKRQWHDYGVREGLVSFLISILLRVARAKAGDLVAANDLALNASDVENEYRICGFHSCGFHECSVVNMTRSPLMSCCNEV